MRKSLIIIGVVASLAFTVSTKAQSNLLPPNGANPATNVEPSKVGLLDSIGSFFSESDTQLGTFSSNKFSLSVGACFENNINADAALRLNYKVWRHIEVESLTRVWNSDQTIKSQGVGIGVGLPINDLKVSAFVTGGWRFDHEKAYLGAALELDKAISKTLYLGTRVETDIVGRKQEPFIALFTGKTF